MDDEVLYRLLNCEVAPSCPLGPPPGAEGAIDDVEHLVELEEPELPLDDFERHVDADNLITDFGPFVAQGRLRPRRDFSTGEIIDYEEVSVDEPGQLSLV